MLDLGGHRSATAAATNEAGVGEDVLVNVRLALRSVQTLLHDPEFLEGDHRLMLSLVDDSAVLKVACIEHIGEHPVRVGQS
jgi:hypothetical protein